MTYNKNLTVTHTSMETIAIETGETPRNGVNTPPVIDHNIQRLVTSTATAIEAQNNGLSRLIGVEEAAEILGKNFIGADTVQDIYGVKIDPERLRSLPFYMTLGEALNALALGNITYLNLDTLGNGNPMTIRELNKYTLSSPKKFNIQLSDKGHLKASLRGGAQGIVSAIGDVESCIDISDRLEWRQTSSEPIAKVDDEKFIAHTDRLIEYVVNGIYKDLLLPKFYQAMADEHEATKAEIQRIYNMQYQCNNDEEKKRYQLIGNTMAGKLMATQYLRPSAINIVQFIATTRAAGVKALSERQGGVWTSTISIYENGAGELVTLMPGYSTASTSIRAFGLWRGDNQRTVFSRSLSYSPAENTL